MSIPTEPTERTELLESLDPLVAAVRSAHADRPELVQVFTDCLRNTLETTVRDHADGGTFVATGDIAAMWLRDSSAQVETYLRVADSHERLQETLVGVVRRQAAYFAVDPYANAFNERPAHEHFSRDEPAPGPWVWERKFELDSLCYPVRLAYRLWRTGTTAHLDAATQAMFGSIVDVMTTEQRHETDSPYRFQRHGEHLPPTETLVRDGRGAPTAQTGMVWSGFRPSDDACTYGYLVPANMFATVSLAQLAEMAEQVFADDALAERARHLRAQVLAGIDAHGVVTHPIHGRMWAYEVDGLGDQLLADDANIPSLLSAPYLGFCAADDPTYLATRAFVLSPENPYHYSGSAAAGIGSPHTPAGWVWPMSLTMQAMTATSTDEQDALVDTLLATTGGTGLMHESFDCNDATRFTRPWFGWANSLFAELVLRRLDQRVR
jgi:meiotically up-regulated gene 157 (Mug157) protein